MRVLLVTRSTSCFKGQTDTPDLVFDRIYKLKGRLLPFFAILALNFFVARLIALLHSISVDLYLSKS